MAAVVCVYTEERWAQIRAAVASLQNQTQVPREIIVVVDHNPALAARVRAAVTGVVVLENRHARGLSGARNTALASTNCTTLAFLDDDAVADSGWLARLTAHLENDAVVGAGGAVKPMWEAGRPSWFPPEFDWVVGCTYEGTPTRLSAVRNPYGGAMVIRRSALQQAGGYSPELGRVGTYPAGCEETELCIRIRRRLPSAVFLFDPTAAIQHHVPRSRCTPRYFLARCYAEGRSKATVSRLSHGAKGLATERSYATRTLPRAVLRGLRDATRGDAAGLLRSAVILAGLVTTVAGYLVERTAVLRGHPSRGLSPVGS